MMKLSFLKTDNCNKNLFTLQKKKADSEDDESDLDLSNSEPVAPRAGGGRARKPVSYNFGEDSEEDSDF